MSIESPVATDQVPAFLDSIGTRPLFMLRLNVRKARVVGRTPGVNRYIGIIDGGSFQGERLRGKVLDGGSDWQTLRPDETMLLDVRIVLETDDGALISMRYPGMRHGPPEVMARIARGETVPPSDYYLRIAPLFETAAPRYDWLNRILSVGIGHRLPDHVLYSVFEIL